MIKYKNNYIYEMVCEVRFSTILKINNDSSEELSLLQDKLRSMFPVYNQVNENKYGFKVNQEDEGFPQVFKRNNLNHNFITEDNKMNVKLTSNYISLITTDYVDWEDYKEKFYFVIECFKDVFKVNNFNRIGIRYINTYSREEFNIKSNKDWSKYIVKELLGLSIREEKSRVYKTNIEIPYDDGSITRIISGFGERREEENVSVPIYILDIDNYVASNNSYEELSQTLDNLHLHNSEVFESLITNDLREKMEVIKSE